MNFRDVGGEPIQKSFPKTRQGFWPAVSFTVLLLWILFWTCFGGPGSLRAYGAGFKEKTISSSSVKQNGAYASGKAAGKKSDSRFVRAMANASLRLLQESMACGESGKNVLISPDSIITAMTMVENGAAGETLTQIKRALGNITGKDYSKYLYTLHRRMAGSSLVTCKNASSIWFHKRKVKLKKAFLKQLATYYGADVYQSAFTSETVSDINHWVYNHTNGKIGEILDRLSPGTRAILVNAVYFKGSWEEPYANPVKRVFTTGSGSKQKVPMLDGTEHTYVTVKGAEGFVKPYQGGTTAFMALLPPKGTSVEQFVRGLTGEDLIRAYKKRISRNVVVYTRMPEFSYDYEISLKKPLQKMGIRKAFGNGADLSKMSKQPLRMDDVLHKTHISVTKTGTEAAAATAVLIKNTSLHMEKQIEKTVYLNRPFVYTIIDTKTGLPLFLGTLHTVK